MMNTNSKEVRKLYTLVLIRRGCEVLLGLKKRGFGEGKWNGFGGKVDPGESIEQAALRELKEESHLSTQNLEKIGVLTFEFEGNQTLMEVHVFETNKFFGIPTETEEMKPEWFTLENIPYDQMWLDDKYWWPYFSTIKNSKDISNIVGRIRLLPTTLKPLTQSFDLTHILFAVRSCSNHCTTTTSFPLTNF